MLDTELPDAHPETASNPIVNPANPANPIEPNERLAAAFLVV